ncbi:MAG: HDIG domain-containing protein [Thermovirga sp.]|nr:HDIG domain-containing protein [Thermovirga sp.]
MKNMNSGEDDRKSNFLTRSNLKLLALLAVWVVVLSSIYSCGWWLRGKSNSFAVGEPAPRTFYARYGMDYKDEDMALWLKEQWSERAFGVLLYEPEKAREVAEKLEYLGNGYYSNMLDSKLVYLLDVLPEEKRNNLLKIISLTGRRLLKSHPISISEEDIWSELEASHLNSSERNVAYQVLLDIFKMAMELDTRSVKAYWDYLKEQFEPVEKRLKVGDVIVWRGEIVTPERAEILVMQGYLPEKFPWKYVVSLALMTILWGMWIRWYLRRRGMLFNFKNEVMVTTAMALGWVLLSVTTYLGGVGVGVLPLVIWLYLILEPSVAFHLVLGAGILGVLASPAYSLMDLILGFVTVSASTCGGYLFIPKVRTRDKLFLAICAIGVLVVLAVLIAMFGFSLQINWETVVIFVLWTVLSSVIGVVFLSLWEVLFGAMTPLKLVELTHPSHVLLKRLQLEAPGTYHHSLMVGTLAEVAAESLNLNSLLVKAGAYFHDVGKLRRPHFFVENQRPGENVHDELAPSMSALVIISHVRDGLELAREYKLPLKIRDFIREHHGTTCLQYFYKKAKMAGDYVSVSQFCYPGPKPKSAETAIVMLADSVEAAVRAVWQEAGVAPDPDIEGIVCDVIETKIKESQLDETPLTLRDISVIKESFIKSLRHMYHSRKVTSLEPEDGKLEEGQNGK